MQNRRERRQLEKQFGLHKLEKSMPAEERENLKKRKADYLKQANLLRIQEEENRRINEEADNWSKRIQTFVSNGMTYEQAEAILKKNQEIDEKRRERLLKKR